MPEVKYISIHEDDDIILRGLGHPLLNEKAVAKYYNELVILDESKIWLGDTSFWREFKRWECNPLENVQSKELPLPMETVNRHLTRGDINCWRRL